MSRQPLHLPAEAFSTMGQQLQPAGHFTPVSVLHNTDAPPSGGVTPNGVPYPFGVSHGDVSPNAPKHVEVSGAGGGADDDDVLVTVLDALDVAGSVDGEAVTVTVLGGAVTVTTRRVEDDDEDSAADDVDDDVDGAESDEVDAGSAPTGWPGAPPHPAIPPTATSARIRPVTLYVPMVPS